MVGNFTEIDDHVIILTLEGKLKIYGNFDRTIILKCYWQISNLHLVIDCNDENASIA